MKQDGPADIRPVLAREFTSEDGGMTNVDDQRWPVVVARLAVGSVAVVAATVSYAHMWDVAVVAGERWRAWLLPVSVDGMVLAASLNAWHAKRRGEDLPGLTMTALVLGLLVSIGANVAAPFLPVLSGGILSAAVACWPPIALALAFEELMRMQRQAGERAASPAANGRQDHSPGGKEVPQAWLSLPQAAAERLRTGADRQDHLPPDMSACRERQSDEQAVAGLAAKLAAGNVRLPLILPGAASRAASVPERAAEQTAILPPVESRSDDRSAARDLVRQDPDGWSGRLLGERFGRSERWGRDQVTAARAELEAERRPRLVAVDE